MACKILCMNKSKTPFRGTCKSENLRKLKKKTFWRFKIQNPSKENCFDYLTSKILQKKIIWRVWPSPMSRWLYSSRGNCGKVLYLRRGWGDLDPKQRIAIMTTLNLSIFLIQMKSKRTDYSISTKINCFYLN